MHVIQKEDAMKGVLWMSFIMFGAGCRTDLGVDPIAAELQNYTLIFARNQTELNVPGGTGRGIYTSRGDGTMIRDLSQHPAGGYGGVRGYDTTPQPSPDGSKIAFRTNRNGGEEIYVMNRDGSNKVNVTNFSGLDLEFSWSPDGTRIVFSRLIDFIYVVHIMNHDGSGLAPVSDPAISSRYPDWSPDGTKIVYSRFMSSTPSFPWQIVVKDLAADSTTILTDSTESGVFPHWSRDGKKVYYLILGAGITTGVRVKALDGTFSNMLAGFYPGRGRPLAWSPNGTEFLGSDSIGLAVIQSDLTSLRRMPVSGFDPQWSPDQKWIVFLRTDDQNLNQVAVVTSDGAIVRSIGDSRYGDLRPSWLPVE